MLLARPTLRELVLEGAVDIQANVERIDHHYAHKNTVRPDLSSWEWTTEGLDRYGGEEKDESELDTEFGIEDQISALEEDVKEYVRDLSDKIYEELEAEWDDLVSDETMAENMVANDYRFDPTTGKRDDDGVPFEQLDERAKIEAKVWYEQHWLDYEWWDCVEDDWKERLEKKGFMDPKISFSGFWSQGDGASFTCRYIDFQKYYSDYDPLKPE